MALGRSQIAALAEPELNCVSMTIGCAIEISPPSTDFKVSFIDLPFLADGPSVTVETLEQ